MHLTAELEQEEGGRWIGEVLARPGVLADGASREDALARVQARGELAPDARAGAPRMFRVLPRVVADAARVRYRLLPGLW